MTFQNDALGPLRPRSKKSIRRRNAWYRAHKNPFLGFLIDITVILIAAVIMSLIIKTFLIRSFFIPSGSMLETLQIDDRIIVNQLTPDLYPIQRGDVVVFRDPGGWLGPTIVEETDPLSATVDWFLSTFGIMAEDSRQHLVKRVIGTEGDQVVCCDKQGRITINGEPIDEPYVPGGQDPSTIKFDVVVPRGSLWVLGDNRGNSQDSRYHTDLPSKGFVSMDWVVGRAFVISWPFENWTFLDNFPDVFKDVPDPSN